NGPTPRVKITQPGEGFTFAATLDELDMPIAVQVENFVLAPLGEEGSDPAKGQVRLYVDDDQCNDPGEDGEPPVPYNRILPNDENNQTVGVDYCMGGVALLNGRSHTLKAQLWHGQTALPITDQITFNTTFTMGDGGTDAADARADSPSDGGANDGSD